MEDIVQDKIRENEEVQRVLRQREEDLEDEINDMFASIASILEERRKDVLAQLRSRVHGKFQKLENQMQSLESLSGNLSYDGADTDCQELKRLVIAETSHISISWNELEDVKQAAGALGEVTSSSCIPSLSTIDGEGCFKSIIFKQSIMTLTTRWDLIIPSYTRISHNFRDSNGEVTPGPSLSDISCHIEPMGAMDVSSLPRLISVQIIAVSSSEYDIVYSLPREGRYKVWVRIYNWDVKTSPFIVTCLADNNAKRKCARSQSSSLPRPRTSSGLRLRSRQSTPCRSRPVSVTSLSSVRRRSGRSSSGGQPSNVSGDSDLLMVVGGKGRGLAEFMNPQGVATTTKGDILVTDSNNQNVQMFSSSGELIVRWGTRGRLPGQLQRPTGITVTQMGSIAVSDYENKWISIFDVDGKYLTKYGAGKLLGPKGITIDREGNLVAVDNKGSSVLIIDPKGKIKRKFGSRGAGLDQFAGPHYVAVNSHDNILVSDFHNHCVKVFTKDGQFLFSFGSKGEGNGQFNGPTGLAVDALDNIIVADWGNSRIQIFDQYGSFLSFVNTDEFKIHGPQGITLSADSNIILSDSGNHCVKTFKYLS